ncbi:MAG: hypothetical protein OEW29_12060 [Acidimicrobiia bacterium]|nr:hypothetical protein [Acidimicrobiia bacterium]
MAAGWPAERAARLLGIDQRRLRRWRLRRLAGTLIDQRPGGNPLHRILPTEEQTVLDLIETWGPMDRSHRKLAHRGSYLRLVWVSPSTVRRIAQKHRISLPKDYTPKPTPARVWPDSITWEPNKIWIWDSRNFTRARRHVVVILDVVSRKWIEHVMTPEFTMTQSQLLFMRALEAEGLATTDPAAGELADREPVLLAWSDNGAQITGEDTRQFLALVSTPAWAPATSSTAAPTHPLHRASRSWTSTRCAWRQLLIWSLDSGRSATRRTSSNP